MIRYSALAAMLVLLVFVGTAWGSTLTINKSNDAPAAGVQSGVPFTYTIGYNWSGGVPAGGTLIIQDIVPAPLIVVSAAPSCGATAVIGGNTVTATHSGIVTTAGSCVLQITVEYPVGTTCPGTSVCDTARIAEQGSNPVWVYSNPSCSKALATNNWQFSNQLYAGCAPCAGNDIIFRVYALNPSGPYGGLNLGNVTLNFSFPALSGAAITSVSGPCGAVLTGPPPAGCWGASAYGSNAVTITLNPSASLSVWSYWYVFYIHVNFPCADSNQTILSTAVWNYTTPCSPKPFSVTDTASVKICKPVSSGSLYKYFYEPTYDPYNPYFYPGTITPGCCGTYAIQYQNTGTVSQTGVVVTDTIPGYMDVSQIYTTVPSGMTSVKEEVWPYPSGPWTIIQLARSSSGSDPIPLSVTPVAKIRWTYTGSLPIATSFTNTIDVCVRTTNFKTGATVVPGQVMRDTAVVQVSGLPNYVYILADTVSAASPKLIAEKSFIGKCAGGASPSGPWYPGDVVRFRIAVANVGSAATTSLTTITDALPPGFTYEGGETYYFGPILPPGNWLSPWTPDCSTDFSSYTPAIQSQLGGPLTSPSIGATNCVWKFPTLPAQCDGTPLYFMIEFNVLIDTVPPTLPGTYANNFTIAAPNAASATSNNAYVVVSSKPGVTAVKQVRSGTSGAWGSTATIPPGGTGQYLLTVTNSGNVPISNLCILDILPHIGDIGILPPYAVRNSAFNLSLNTPITSILPAGFTPSYYNGSPANLGGTVNPSRTAVCGGFCGVTNPAGATSGTWGAVLPSYGTYAFSVSAGTNTLAPGASLKVIVPFTVPANAKVGSMACNSFAYQCNPTGTTTCLAAEPVDVCITVGTDTSSGACCPCDTIGITPSAYQNLQEQWKTFTIYHLHVCSPITTIDIKYFDCGTGLPIANLSYVNGGNVHVYRNTPYTNTLLPYCAFNISDNYQHMPLTGCLVGNVLPTYGTPPSQDRVSFDLGLNYGVTPPSWCIHVIIHYADGDSCVDTIPPWKPTPPSDGTGIGSGTLDSLRKIYVVPIKIDPEQFPETVLGFATATLADTADEIVGGSGGIWESQVDSTSPSIPPTVRPQLFVQNKHTALFELQPTPAGSFGTMQFYLFVSHPGDSSRKPVVKLGLFDNEANLLSTDSIQASITTSGVTPSPGIVANNGIAILAIRPDPAQTAIDVQYTLGTNEVAKLEMFNTLGQQVGVLADGFENQGDHTTHFNISSLAGGTYYLRLSTLAGQTSASFQIVH